MQAGLLLLNAAPPHGKRKSTGRQHPQAPVASEVFRATQIAQGSKLYSLKAVASGKHRLQ